jgi:hypothetical protein
MIVRRFFHIVVLLGFLLFLWGFILPLGEQSDTIIDSDFAGEWTGEARSIMSWSVQKIVKISLNILPDGKITGTFGDARITGGEVKENSVLKHLGNPDYLIDLVLEGPIVKDEGIERTSVRLLVDLKNDVITGDFRTSGSKFGDKNTMQMTGADLVLTGKK